MLQNLLLEKFETDYKKVPEIFESISLNVPYHLTVSSATHIWFKRYNQKYNWSCILLYDNIHDAVNDFELELFLKPLMLGGNKKVART